MCWQKDFFPLQLILKKKIKNFISLFVQSSKIWRFFPKKGSTQIWRYIQVFYLFYIFVLECFWKNKKVALMLFPTFFYLTIVLSIFKNMKTNITYINLLNLKILIFKDYILYLFSISIQILKITFFSVNNGEINLLKKYISIHLQSSRIGKFVSKKRWMHM